MNRFLKLRLVLSSTGSVLLLAVVAYAGLTAVARWAEIEHDTYPWKDEDYLRYILPSMHEGRGAQRILLIGPSEAREDLIYQRFERAFPERETFQGGQSLGTFDDILLVLEYIDRVYGPEARPQTLVLGITPRFVGNLSSGDQSPIVESINRYSSFLRVEQMPEGSRLVDKSLWDGLVSRARFLSKQRKRYLTAMFTILNVLMDDELPYEAYEDAFFSKIPPPRTPIPMLVKSFKLFPLRATLGRWSEVYISPYKYHQAAPRPQSSIIHWLHETDSFWYKTHAWNPADDALLIRGQFERLVALTARWNTRLYVVNLPEHPLNREGYQPGYYEYYLEQVQEALGETPFLNLRETSPAEDFYDVGHLTLPGALRVTDRVITFMQTHSAP